MENENIPPIVEETKVPQASPESDKKINLFKIAVVIIGILIVVGLFANAYLMVSKKETGTKTSDSSLVATPTIDPTANWKTYTDQEFGFSFKYPPLWRHEINRINQYAGFFLVGTNPDFFSVDHPGNEILAVGGVHESKCTYKDAKEGCLPKIGPDTRFDFFTIDGRSAVRTFNGKPPMESLVTVGIWVNPSDNQIIPIVIFNSDRAKPYFDQILSTFKFTSVQ